MAYSLLLEARLHHHSHPYPSLVHGSSHRHTHCQHSIQICHDHHQRPLGLNLQVDLGDHIQGPYHPLHLDSLSDWYHLSTVI